MTFGLTRQPAVRWQSGAADQMFCGGAGEVRGGGVPRGGEDCQVGEQSIFGQQIIHTQCRGRVTHTN